MGIAVRLWSGPTFRVGAAEPGAGAAAGGNAAEGAAAAALLGSAQGGAISDPTTNQLTQAMASFGGGSGASGSVDTFLLGAGADASQQTLVATPQHA